MKVIKKLGHRQPFDIEKIYKALRCTAEEINSKFLRKDWKELKPRIESRLESIIKDREEIYFWEIDEVVEDALLRSRFNEIAKQYIKSRAESKRDKLNDIGVSPIAMYILKDRYLRKDSNGEPIETVKELFCRVASNIASVEKTKHLREKYTKLFSTMLINRDALPNSPALVAAGSKHRGTLSACFAYGIEDSLDDIMEVVHKTAKTFQYGGGVGISIAKLREKGAPIRTTNGKSSGSVEFLNLFDTMCSTIKTGGFRRGALMCLTEYDHPDIEWFIQCKNDVDKLNNMNISVLVDNKFINAVKNGDEINLISRITGKPTRKLSARLLFEEMAHNIWLTGEPGILFYDRINKDNPTPHLGDIRICNPCAESTLLNGEACNLLSINLVNHMTEDKKDIDWSRLGETIKLSVRFLDNMIDASPYPTKEVEKAVKATRKIGIGIMGFHDTLIQMGVKYSSPEAINMVNKVYSFLTDIASEESKQLGEEKGYYSAYINGCRKRRNSIVTIQAPSGTLSIIAGVSPGIEPNFYKSYVRKIGGEDGSVMKFEHPLRDNPNFETASEISPEQHLLILAKAQKFIENSISKTCNVPEETTVEDIKKLILKAHELDVKGITIFRENCNRESLVKCEDCKI